MNPLLIALLFTASILGARADEAVVEVRAARWNAGASPANLVFEEEEIRRSPEKSLGDFLKFQPGFQVSTNFQGIATTSIRGLPGGNIVVFWNGVRLNDPLDPTTSFDFARLQLSAMQKIEIIRGPEAAIHGSGATGAVIFITTLPEDAPDGISGDAEARFGSYQSWGLATKIENRREKIQSVFFADVAATRGISAANAALGNTERDGRQAQQGLVHSRYQWTPHWQLSTALLGAHAKSDADLRGGVGGDEQGAADSEATVAASLAAIFTPPTPLENRLSFSLQNDSRHHENSVEYARYRSQFYSLSNETRWKFDSASSLISALEMEFEKGKSSETTGFISGDRTTAALRTQYTRNFFPFYFKTGARFEKDLDARRKGAWAVFISPGFTLTKTGTQFSASAGRSLKRASLYQLYSSYGSDTLSAETLWAYEVGVLQALDFMRSQLQMTWFWNHADESIDFNFATLKYFNGGEKENYGVEAVMESELTRAWQSRLEYTWTHSSTLRVAAHKATAVLNFTPATPLTFTGEARYLGEREDIDPTTFARKSKRAFVLFNTAVTFRLTPFLQARIRVDNLLDKEYEEIDGFGSPGRRAELALKYSF